MDPNCIHFCPFLPGRVQIHSLRHLTSAFFATNFLRGQCPELLSPLYALLLKNLEILCDLGGRARAKKAEPSIGRKAALELVLPPKKRS